jgi:HSP20 family molecular chaperone IbpA
LLPDDREIERDNIAATLKDGFLTITLPRRERAALVSRNIPIAIEE